MTLELAICHGKLHQFEQAENYFQTAINNPVLEGVVVVPIHLGYANLLEKLERFEDSFEQLLIVFREQERREDQEKDATMQRLRSLAPKIGLSADRLEKRMRKGKGKVKR